MANFGKQSLNSMKGVHPYLIAVMVVAIKNTPIDFTITDGGRTDKAQYDLWLKGRDKNGNIIDKSKVVTNADGIKGKSNHQMKEDGFYHAVDLYAYLKGKVQFNDTKSLVIIAEHILNTAKDMGINIKWGGHFPATKTLPYGWDKPHFELA